ncbi:hypothetical protein NQ317_005987 [Molorchus minor]|uniref:Uncharacterized protein n=1 Tax=Molorchus minor TaxID=1323400 RepID=A0ABQ9IQK4_9CUCU|nr:hypothetical protein NQ317_005987 [Molorchus minor]
MLRQCNMPCVRTVAMETTVAMTTHDSRIVNLVEIFGVIYAHSSWVFLKFSFKFTFPTYGFDIVWKMVK